MSTSVCQTLVRIKVVEGKLQGHEVLDQAFVGTIPTLGLSQELKASNKDFGLQECQNFTLSDPSERGGKDAHAHEIFIFYWADKFFTVPLRSCLSGTVKVKR